MIHVGASVSTGDIGKTSVSQATESNGIPSSTSPGWTSGLTMTAVLNRIRTEFDQPTELTINGRAEDKEQAVVLRAQYDF